MGILERKGRCERWRAYADCMLWGFRDRKTLETAGVDDLIDRPDELLQFV